jgi:hypothetical protein
LIRFLRTFPKPRMTAITIDDLKEAQFHANALGGPQLAEKRKRRAEITKCLDMKKILKLTDEEVTDLKEKKAQLTKEIDVLIFSKKALV